MADPPVTGREIVETWRRSQRQQAWLSMVLSAAFAVAALYFLVTGVFVFGVPLLGVAGGLFMLSRWWWRKFDARSAAA